MKKLNSLSRGFRPERGNLIEWGHPLSKGLFNCWLLNERSGRNFKDIAKGGSNGTFSGSGNPWGTDSRFRPNTANTAYINLGVGITSSKVNGARFLAMDAIFIATSSPSSNSAGQFQIFLVGVNSTAFNIRYQNSGGTLQLNCGARSQAADALQQATTPFSILNVYTHILGTVDYTNKIVKLYVNGILKATLSATFGSATYAHSTGQTQTDGIGSTGQVGNYFDGMIETTRLWVNRPFTDRMARDLYTAPYAFISPQRRRWFGTIIQYASPTGPKNGSTFVDDNSNAGNVAWTNPGNAQLNDAVYATSTLLLGQKTDYLKATGFGFQIPTNHQIDGIVVEIERKSGLINDITDDTVKLVKAGSVVGNNLASASQWPQAEAYATYGGASNLWGTTWTPAQVNASNFGAVLAATASSADTASVDHIRITIYHSIPVAVGGSGFMSTRGGYWGDL